MRRAIMLAACSLGIAPLSGCLMVPISAYPTLDYIPSVRLEAPSSEVHAFRVDIDKHSYDHSIILDIETQTTHVGTSESIKERLTELPVANAAKAPAQVRNSFTYGFALYGVISWVSHTTHSVALRLYRPGYELVEIESWEMGRKVEWKPVADLEGQEKVLNELFQYSLAKGPKSPDNRAALLFGASEYEHLEDNVKKSDRPARFDVTETDRFEANPIPITRSRLAIRVVELRKCAEE